MERHKKSTWLVSCIIHGGTGHTGALPILGEPKPIYIADGLQDASVYLGPSIALVGSTVTGDSSPQCQGL